MNGRALKQHLWPKKNWLDMFFMKFYKNCIEFYKVRLNQVFAHKVKFKMKIHVWIENRLKGFLSFSIEFVKIEFSNFFLSNSWKKLRTFVEFVSKTNQTLTIRCVCKKYCVSYFVCVCFLIEHSLYCSNTFFKLLFELDTFCFDFEIR